MTSKSGGEAKWAQRASSLGKAAIYGSLVRRRVASFRGSMVDARRSEQATKGILGWPAGRWIVCGIAVGIVGARSEIYRGVSGEYKEKLKKDEMSTTELTWTTRIAVAGLVARAVVFGVISWFFLKAAADYDAKQARGLDGASKARRAAIRDEAAGLSSPWAFRLCAIQARYREV